MPRRRETDTFLGKKTVVLTPPGFAPAAPHHDAVFMSDRPQGAAPLVKSAVKPSPAERGGQPRYDQSAPRPRTAGPQRSEPSGSQPRPQRGVSAAAADYSQSSGSRRQPTYVPGDVYSPPPSARGAAEAGGPSQSAARGGAGMASGSVGRPGRRPGKEPADEAAPPPAGVEVVRNLEATEKDFRSP